MKKLLLPLLALALPAQAAINLEAIKPDGFARGVAFTVNGYEANRSALTNFPVLVRISEAGISGFNYGDVYSHTDNGKTVPHLAFTDAEGNALAFDVDTWTNTTSLVWTTLPVMTNGTQFAMFWRAAQGAADAAAGGNAFTNFVGVWHLGESGSGTASTKVHDSSGHDLTGTATGTKALSVDASEGILGGSWRFNDEYNRNGSAIIVDFNDQTKLDAVNALGTDFTVSFWMKPYGTIAKKEGVCWNALIGRKTDGKSNYWGLQLDEDPKNLRVFGSNGSSFTSASSYSFSQNNWYKIDVAFYKDATNKGKFCYYVNGASKETDKAMSGDKAAAQGSGPLGIGNFTSLSAERCFWGAMDEVRLVCGTNSADRVAADYATVATPSFLVASSVAEFEEEPKPVFGHTISDIGAAFVQFSGSVSELGEGATAASILLKVWKTGDAEPADWTTNATGLAKSASYTATRTGLEPLTGYTYLIKAVNNLTTPYDSDVETGTFTTSGVGDAGTGGAVERQLDDFVHVFRVSERGQAVYEFTPPEDVGEVDALVVAGGGPGGYYAGGGGGAGGLIYTNALRVTGGETYTITVGTGGVASVSATAYGSNGGNSSIVGHQVNLVAVGGGAGGNGRLNDQTTTRAGVAGGSGGGSSWKQNSAGAGTANQGYAGGTTASDGRSEDHAGGGGGAGGAGGSVATATGAQSSGAGGIGREIGITGEPVYYAGGGGGGGVISFVNDGYGLAGAGGGGGGGGGGQKAATDESAIAGSGTDGLGGGGGGGSTYSVATYKGGNGGSGVVVIRYGAGGDGDGVMNPTISLTGLSYDDESGDATVTYRVGWAGDGYDRADVSAIWGFYEDSLDNTNAVSTAPAIGQGTGSFSLPRVSKTVYVRLLATNGGGYTGVSPEVKSLVLFNPAAPVATVSASQTIGSGNSGVSKAALEADVTNLGTGAESVNGVFQICRDKFFDEGTYTTVAVTNGPITTPGVLRGGATGLLASSTYWVRAVLTNDTTTAGEPTVYETDPISFTTAQAGWPYGRFQPSNDNPAFTVTTNSISAAFRFASLGEGAVSGSCWLEVSTTHDVKEGNTYTERFYTGYVAGSTTTNTVVAADLPAIFDFTVEGLQPETDYYVRFRVSNNDGRETSNSDAYEFPFATPPPTAHLTIPALPEHVNVDSVKTNGVSVSAVDNAYPILGGTTVTVTFSPDPGFNLVGNATTNFVMNADVAIPLASIPTAEAIVATATLTIPDLASYHVTLVSVTVGGTPIPAAAENAYTVSDGDTVVVTFAADDGYRFTGADTATVTMNGDTTLSGIPATEPIPPVMLTFPELPANVTVVSVATNGVAVEPVEGVYTVLDGSSVTVTFAAAPGYVLSGPAVSTLAVTGDTAFPAASFPAAIPPSQAIRINEIMASNPSVDKGGITSELGIAEMDWIELYNGSSEAIDATGWYLTDSDKVGKETKATILGSCVVPAGGYKIVWLDKTHVDPAEYGPDEAFAVLKLSSGGELLKLSDAGVNLVDKVDFSTKPQIKGYSYGPGTVSYGPFAGTGPYVYMKTATPGAANVAEGWGDFTPTVTFSEPHGYKTGAFDLALSCADMPDFEGAGIYYTLDGSSPATNSAASHLYDTNTTIRITRTTVVRAAVPIEGSILQFDASATYVFLDDVLAQAHTTTAPEGIEPYFPAKNAVNGQNIYYGMDQDIVNGADRDRLLRGFTNSIATLSVVVDPQNLFNSSTGIYVNPKGEGEAWERQILLEGFDPTDVGADFAQPAGIRIRGGNSRKSDHPKHSLRFFFRSSYGKSSLKAKMFPGEPLSLTGEGKMAEEIGEYDKLDLRTSQNLSWANEGSANDTFVTEVFSRDSQRDLGQPYTRSRYYNLFINGQYWGLYQTQERGDEHFGEAYLGGDSLQYDLIKTASTYVGNTLSYSIECNEGTWDAWSNLWRIATQEGFGEGHYDNYNKVLGLNPDGTRNPAYPILLNAESLMVYMLVSHYTADQDGPTSPFSTIDKGHANNFYALRNRDDAGIVNGFVFLRHDGEVSMGQNGNTGASANPTFWGTDDPDAPAVGSPDPSGLGKLKFRTIPYFTPAELHYLLMQNPDYKRAYADLFYRECLREGGAMTVENATARYTNRMAEIDDAIVCEAARWGKGKDYNKNFGRSNWLNACKTSTTFITNRLANMKAQYVAAKWYPAVDAPSATNAQGVALADGDKLDPGEKFYFAGVEAGTVYYTTNGIDPRAADDSIAVGAIAYDPAAGAELPTLGAVVKARVLTSGANSEWSALYEVELDVNLPSDQQLYVRIAEIMSVPTDDPVGEFITLTNLNASAAVSLQKLTVKAEKSTKTPTVLFTVADDISLPAGGTLRLNRTDYWPGEDQKLKNNDIVVELLDSNNKPVQKAIVKADEWFEGVCKGTGRYFVALEHLGYTDDGEVTQERQWTASPEETTKKTTILIY